MTKLNDLRDAFILVFDSLFGDSDDPIGVLSLILFFVVLFILITPLAVI